MKPKEPFRKSLYIVMHNAMLIALQKLNVVLRLSNRVLRKLDEFEKREDLPDRTTTITLLLWRGLREYEKKEGITLGGKKTGKQDKKTV